MKSVPKNLPKYVWPCGKKYKVKVVPMELDDYGETIGHDKLITLNSDPSKKDKLWEILFHEYLHAIFHSTGLVELMPHDRGVHLEEGIVLALQEHLFPLIDLSKLGKKH